MFHRVAPDLFRIRAVQISAKGQAETINGHLHFLNICLIVSNDQPRDDQVNPLCGNDNLGPFHRYAIQHQFGNIPVRRGVKALLIFDERFSGLGNLRELSPGRL